jgi:uncharacterized damage-inducible protein DinB
VGTPRTLAEELESLDKVHKNTLAEAALFPLERWDDVRVNEEFGIRRKIGIILFGINEHEAHHRAQLMTYLRMLGTPAPEPFVRK